MYGEVTELNVFGGDSAGGVDAFIELRVREALVDDAVGCEVTELKEGGVFLSDFLIVGVG